MRNACDVRRLGRFKGLLSTMTLGVTVGYAVLSVSTWGSGFSVVAAFIAFVALIISAWLLWTGSRQEQFRG
jgi:hypothetical protein